MEAISEKTPPSQKTTPSRPTEDVIAWVEDDPENVGKVLIAELGAREDEESGTHIP